MRRSLSNLHRRTINCLVFEVLSHMEGRRVVLSLQSRDNEIRQGSAATKQNAIRCMHRFLLGKAVVPSPPAIDVLSIIGHRGDVSKAE